MRSCDPRCARQRSQRWLTTRRSPPDLLDFCTTEARFRCSYVLNADYDGSVWRFLAQLASKEGIKAVVNQWPALFSSKTAEALLWVTSFGALQAALQLFVPGKTFHGPVSPKGNVPHYKVRSAGSWCLPSPCSPGARVPLFGGCTARALLSAATICIGTGVLALLRKASIAPNVAHLATVQACPRPRSYLTTPRAQANGVACFLITGVLFILGARCDRARIPTHALATAVRAPALSVHTLQLGPAEQPSEHHCRAHATPQAPHSTACCFEPSAQSRSTPRPQVWRVQAGAPLRHLWRGPHRSQRLCAPPLRRPHRQGPVQALLQRRWHQRQPRLRLLLGCALVRAHRLRAGLAA